MKPPREYNGEEPSPEPWITKQRLAEHLSVTTRWIELQQRRGLPHIHTPGMNRYRISEVCQMSHTVTVPEQRLWTFDPVAGTATETSIGQLIANSTPPTTLG